ncbi:MAG TPA: laccase domain-containing protein, partial [Acidimicrobiales bacterium]|nr:laccase domain-containing protein [Acidimicrobiales bacterium]
VVGAALEAMRRLGAGSSLRAVVGPCIRAHCYEFGAGDLDGLERALGPGVRATTVAGRPALDLVEAVRLALASGGVDAWADEGRCTACSPAYWSHRAGGDPQRQALIAGLAP